MKKILTRTNHSVLLEIEMRLLNELPNHQILPYFWRLQSQKVVFLDLESLKTELNQKKLTTEEEKKLETLLYGDQKNPLYTGWTKSRLEWACSKSGFKLLKTTPISDHFTEAFLERKSWKFSNHLDSTLELCTQKIWNFRKNLRKTPGIFKAKIKSFFKPSISSQTKKNVILNLGAGDENYENFIKVDIGGIQDIYDNIVTLKKIKPESVDQIYSNHVLEHIPPCLIRIMLKRWHEVLKPGGEVRIRVPDALKSICALNNYWEEASELKIKELGFPNYLFKESAHSGVLDSNAVIQCVYGWSDSTPFLWSLSNQHKSLWTPNLAKERFESSGFTVTFSENLGTIQTVVVAKKVK